MWAKIFLLFYTLSFNLLVAQFEPSVLYDNSTGNYIIEYLGYKDYPSEERTIIRLIFEPSTKINPFIKSFIQLDNSHYCYHYVVTNSVNSIQRLEDFYVEVDATLIGISQPNETWKFTRYSYMPVLGWYNSKDPNGLNHPLNGIAQDSSVSGFSFTSTGLPSIANAYFKGKPTSNLIFPDDGSEEITQMLRPLEKFPSNTVIRPTISPKNLPISFTITNFIETIMKYNQKSLEIGWINNEYTFSKYDSLLTFSLNKFHQQDTAAARSYLQEILREADMDSSSSLTSEAYALLKYNTEYLLEQIPEPQPTEPIVKLLSSSDSPLTGGVCQYYEGGWKTATDNGNGTFSIETDKTSLSIRMTYAYGTQTLSNVPWGTEPVVFQTVNTQVQLKGSEDNLIDAGTVKYYAGGWRDFGVTENGIASKELLPVNYSFRMTYAFASNDKQQNLNDNTTIVFQTVPATVQLKNSSGNFIDQGSVQYYSGGWRSFGTTTNGAATLELLPNKYSFRMTYAFASNDKQQNLNDNPTVVFQTVPATVQLKDSQGNLIDEGLVQYYSGGWRSFGTTSNGIAILELLPNNYSFRMTYAFASNDKQQNIGTDPTVIFQTVPATVQLKNSTGNFIDQGTVQYYSGGWRSFGITTNGIATLELLPNNYSFRMTYAFASNNKQQNIETDPIVIFQTVPATVQLKNSLGEFIDQGTVQYYSGGWRNFGTTTNGAATLELLPNNYSFRMKHEFISNDKAQNVGTDNIVGFTTVNCIVRVNNSQGQPVNNAAISYYSGGWRQIGATVNGEIKKELLPKSLTFRAAFGGTSQDKTQDTAINNLVEFIIGQ